MRRRTRQGSIRDDPLPTPPGLLLLTSVGPDGFGVGSALCIAGASWRALLRARPVAPPAAAVAPA